jgi:predicted amidophosphoribosyltransferase
MASAIIHCTRARSPQSVTCSQCKRRIPAGEPYVRIACADPGGDIFEDHCMRCRERQESGSDWPPVFGLTAILTVLALGVYAAIGGM